MKEDEKLYSIPGFRKYLVSKSGKVWSSFNNRWLTASKNEAGYFSYSMIPDQGEKYTMGRHRVLCIVFKPLEGVDLNALLVNHIDGVPGNDWLDNLEWVTHQGNIEHAGLMGLTTKCTPCQVMNVDTGEIVKYPSAIKAARALKIPKDCILWRLKHGEHRVYPERKQYRIGWQDNVWVPNPDPEASILEYGNSRGIYVKDLDTSEVKLFPTLSSVSEAFGISPGCLSKRLKKETQPWFQPNMLMKWESNPTNWRSVPDKYIEYENSTISKVVILVAEDPVNNKIFLSAKECSDQIGINHTTVLWRVNSKTKPKYDGFEFHYYSNYHLVHLKSNP